jgi:hypothetical protein
MTNPTAQPNSTVETTPVTRRHVSFSAPEPIDPSETPSQFAATDPIDYAALYSNLQTAGSVPNASVEIVDRNHAVFQSTYLDLAQVKQKLIDSGQNPPLVTVYADVLSAPDELKWSLAGSALVVYARRIQAGNSVQINLDYRTTQSARFVLFTREFVGSLDVVAAVAGKDPVVFNIPTGLTSPGLMVSWDGKGPATSKLTRANGLEIPVSDLFTVALDNSFILGSLLSDQNPELALKILTWVKDWAAESNDLLRLFMRSSPLVALLTAQLNAKANGAAFVPYLTASVYTDLARAFVKDASQYESDYLQLSTQKELTEQNIQLAKTLLDNSQYQSDYVNGLKSQALTNYTNAKKAVEMAQDKFSAQKIEADQAATDFQEIGIPEYRRQKAVEAVISVVTALVSFGVGVAEMFIGDEAALPMAAAKAAQAVEDMEEIAEEASEIAKLAREIADQMKKIKKIIEGLKKIYEFSQSMVELANKRAGDNSMVAAIQGMDLDTGGIDLSAIDEWEIYRLKADTALKEPIKAGIQYAADYKAALDTLVIYAQSLAAAQLAVIRAGQEYARVLLQQQLAQQQQQRLQGYVDSLKVGEAPIVGMMQQFYQRYLDSKSDLLTALEFYRASYFYWALTGSAVRPKVIDPVNKIDTGMKDLTAITLDTQKALETFDPPPTKMTDKQWTITRTKTIAAFRKNKSASWVLKLHDDAFLDLDRIRITTVRVWLEGAKIAPDKTIMVRISTSGSYRDRLNDTKYQFTAKPLQRVFEYHVESAGLGKPNPDWRFDNGDLGYIEIDGSVDTEVSYAYFQPTPFTEWTVEILKGENPGLDLSGVSKITMQFQGSAIYTVDAKKSVAV